MLNFIRSLEGTLSQSIIDKIAKALNKAKSLKDTGDPAYIREGEFAAKLAEKWMREHAISMSDLQEVNQGDDPLTGDEFQVGRTLWKARLAWALAEHCNCHAIRYTDRKNTAGSQSAYMKVFGYKSDIEIFHYLYNICERQIRSATKKWKKTRRAELLEQGIPKIPYSEGQNFRESMALGLWSRLREIRSESKTEDPKGSSLVLARSRSSEEYMKNEVGATGTYRSSRTITTINSDAYDQGRKIILNPGINTETSEKLN